MLQMPALDCGNKNGKRGGEGEEKEKKRRSMREKRRTGQVVTLKGG